MPGFFNLARSGGLATSAIPWLRPLPAQTLTGTFLILLLATGGALADGGATLTPRTIDGEAFYCGDYKDVAFGYVPDLIDTPVLRAYSARVIAPYGLDFDQGDILVHSPLVGVNDTHLIIENGVNDYTIDFTFLDAGAGLSEAADLFTISFHDRGFNIPNAPVGVETGRFRTPENQDFPVDFSATTDVDVICLPPPRVVISPEPEYTPGTTNTISWDDGSWAGAVEYRVQMGTDPEFTTIADESGWIPELSYEFTDLVDGQEYFFRANSRNYVNMVSFASNVVNTIQDAIAPVTSADPLDPDMYLTDFEISFQAVETGSGMDQVELFYRFDGGPWTSYGGFTVSPIVFSATDGDGQYEFYTVGTDVAGNVETAPTGPQAATTLDTTRPFGTFVINADSVATKNPEVRLNITVVRADEMRFSNNGSFWPQGWIPLSDKHTWTIPASEGNHTVYGEFRDGILQVMPVSDQIRFDVTPTGAVTSVTSLPGHEGVFLTWTNPANPDFERVEVWRGLLHDGAHGSTYPSYAGSTVPAAPMNRAAAFADPDWEQVGLADIGSNWFLDSVAERGIYYYTLFAMDDATNFSPPSGSLHRATNYILGDVAQPYDGLVKPEDISILGAAYGVTSPDPYFNGEADVGPTHDGSGSGIPEPNGTIDFQDEMIFGMNYTSSAKSLVPAENLPRAGKPVSLAWRSDQDNTWTLDLVAPCPLLKGVHLGATLPQGMIPLVTAGEAVTSGDDPFFLKNIDHRGLAAGLVILGNQRGMAATGTLLTVEFPAGLDPTFVQGHRLVLDLRDLNNRPLEFDLEGKSGSGTPAVFSLSEAYPNPFNPVTTIRFSIPGELPVRLEIFGMDGRRVAVLIDETLVAGPHEAVWLGRDESGRQVASGVYFSKLLAGSQSQVRKMTLMK